MNRNFASGKLQVRGDCVAEIDKIQQDIIQKSGAIAKELKKGKDIEIRTCNGGLKVLSADKKVLK